MSTNPVTIDLSTATPIPSAQPVQLDMSTAQPIGATAQPTEKANLFIPGVGYTQQDVPAGTAKHYEAGYMHGIQVGAGLAAGTGLAGGAVAAAPAAAGAMATAVGASASHAGDMFNELENTIGDHEVDTSAVEDAAEKALDWAKTGGQRIKVIADFARRTAADDAEPVTYSEARQFLSNSLRRLSPAEKQALPPAGKHYLGDFASSLNNAIQDVADDAGVGTQYRDAVSEYSRGMGLQSAWQTAKDVGAKVLTTGAGLGGAYAIAKKFWPY